MIVYGEREQRVDTRELLRTVESTHDPVERLVRFGQWESGVVDALCPLEDDIVDLLTAPLPANIAIRPQEGFAYYALYPEQYSRAAARFVHEHRPEACVVVGIRSIGTALSTVVAGALPCPVWRFTVRPRGHPFDRRLSLSQRMQEGIRDRAQNWFLVVDEGPGMSGSSFSSVAEALNALGVPDERIVFFPSHNPDSSKLLSDRSRLRWPRHKKYVDPLQLERYIPFGARDLSGGQWRTLTGCDAAVQPFHERLKFLDDRQLWKFAGLAHYGRAKFERACELASSGFSPEALALENGFLVTTFVDGTPARTCDRELVGKMASYIENIRTRYTLKEPVRYQELREMIRVNTGIEAPERYSLIEDQPVVAVDGRMLPQEWLQMRSGDWIKTDAVDHHDDHFFPGCQDIAWDIAGASVEFDLPATAILERLPPEQYLPERVDFYTIAYLAYRIGYCTMAEQTLGASADGRRFAALKDRYTAALVGKAVRPVTSNA